jgi:hypothetical protein
MNINHYSASLINFASLNIQLVQLPELSFSNGAVQGFDVDEFEYHNFTVFARAVIASTITLFQTALIVFIEHAPFTFQTSDFLRH